MKAQQLARLAAVARRRAVTRRRLHECRLWRHQLRAVRGGTHSALDNQGAAVRVVAGMSAAFAPAPFSATALLVVAFPQLSSADDASQFASG